MARARILVIEDSPTYGELATILLEGMGYAVTLVPTAEEGLKMARDTRPDLILMDVNLPSLDGFGAVRILRRDPVTQGIPAVGLTAADATEEEERHRAKEAGFDAYVTKPIDEESLGALVATFLSGGSPPHGNAS